MLWTIRIISIYIKKSVILIFLRGNLIVEYKWIICGMILLLLFFLKFEFFQIKYAQFCYENKIKIKVNQKLFPLQ